MMASPAFGMGASSQRPFVTGGLGNLARIFGYWKGLGDLLTSAWLGELHVKAEP